jgi:F-type H+-transporting ATPase subunit delta
MPAGSLARRYARAVMDIGIEAKNFEQLGREMRTLANAMDASPELVDTLSNPAFAREERLQIVEALLRRFAASKTTINFAKLLLDRDRLAAVPDIARELEVMIDDKIGRVSAVVTSATKLTPAQLTKLKTALEQTSGKKVDIEQREDPELLGGVVAKVGDIVYDGSLRTQLHQMRAGLVD